MAYKTETIPSCSNMYLIHPFCILKEDSLC